jgi:hypothetical protein
MTDQRQMGMNPETEAKRIEERGKGSYVTNFNWFSMLPKEDEESANNRLYFGLFRPSKFSYFGHVIPEQLYTYYVKLPLHYMYDPVEGRDIPILCVDGVNEMIKTAIPDAKGEPFPGQKCMYCSMEQAWWKKANERREQLGGKKVPYEALQKDAEWMEKRDKARGFRNSDRYFFLVLDVDKLQQKKMMGEEEMLQMQFYNGAEKIFKGLYQKVKLGYQFWSLDNPNTIVIVRDNKDGARRPDYIIDMEKDNLVLSEEVKELILTEDLYPDLGIELGFQSPDEQIEMLKIREDDVSMIGVKATVAPVSAPAPAAATEAATPAPAAATEAATPAPATTGVKLATNKQPPTVPESASPAPDAATNASPIPPGTPETVNTPDPKPIKDSASLVTKLQQARKSKGGNVDATAGNGQQVGGKNYRSF